MNDIDRFFISMIGIIIYLWVIVGIVIGAVEFIGLGFSGAFCLALGLAIAPMVILFLYEVTK